MREPFRHGRGGPEREKVERGNHAVDPHLLGSAGGPPCAHSVRRHPPRGRSRAPGVRSGAGEQFGGASNGPVGGQDHRGERGTCGGLVAERIKEPRKRRALPAHHRWQLERPRSAKCDPGRSARGSVRSNRCGGPSGPSGASPANFLALVCGGPSRPSGASPAYFLWLRGCTGAFARVTAAKPPRYATTEPMRSGLTKLPCTIWPSAGTEPVCRE